VLPHWFSLRAWSGIQFLYSFSPFLSSILSVFLNLPRVKYPGIEESVNLHFFLLCLFPQIGPGTPGSSLFPLLFCPFFFQRVLRWFWVWSRFLKCPRPLVPIGSFFSKPGVVYWIFARCLSHSSVGPLSCSFFTPLPMILSRFFLLPPHPFFGCRCALY